MKKMLVFFVAWLIAGVSVVAAQAESSNAPFTGIKPVGSKGWIPQFTYTNIPKSGSYGAEFDGTYIYITKWSGDTIWRYTPAGVLDSIFKIPGVSGLRDLAYDGTYFYGGSNGTVIYKMDFTNCTLVGTISVPASAGSGVTVRNICYDPVTDGLWVGAWDSNLALISKTGILLNTITSATHGQTAMAGSAYDTITPGGPFIWIITADANPAVIHQISVTTGQSTGIAHLTTDDINTTGASSGGGLFIAQNLIPGTATLGGIIQNDMLFGYDMSSLLPDSFDVAMDILDIPTSSLTNNALQVKGNIINKGMITLTSFDLYYSINGGQVVSQNLTGLNVPFGQTYSFTHDTVWTPSISGDHIVEVWANNPNGMQDQFGANDTLIAEVSVVDSAAFKRVLIEQATGAWCGFCPDGSYVLSQILAANPTKVIGVAIHNGDGMAFANGNTVNSTYAQGYPNGYVDRVLFPDQEAVGISRGVWAAKAQKRMAELVPVEVEAQNVYDPANRRITIDLTASFYSNASGDYRVNAYIVEDSVTGSGSGYNQVNNYNTTVGHPYYGAGNPIIGYNHRHVLRAMLGGSWGSAGVIPSTINKYDVFTKQYTYDIPGTVNPNRLAVVVLVQKYNTNINKRAIINAARYSLGVIDGINKLEHSGELLSLFPNPTQDIATVEFMLTRPSEVNIEVYTMMGAKIMTQSLGNLPAGEHLHQLVVSNCSPGVYILKVHIGSNVTTQKFTVR